MNAIDAAMNLFFDVLKSDFGYRRSSLQLQMCELHRLLSTRDMASVCRICANLPRIMQIEDYIALVKVQSTLSKLLYAASHQPRTHSR